MTYNIDELKKEAENGDLNAMHKLMLHYKYNTKKTKDNEKLYQFWARKRVETLKENANNGDRQAMLRLSFMFQTGNGVEKNIHTAFTWAEKYDRALDRAYPKSGFYNQGIVELNKTLNSLYRQKIINLQNDAQKGDIYAMEALIHAYKNGVEGIKKDLVMAEFWENEKIRAERKQRTLKQKIKDFFKGKSS